jgi:DNA-damage-inducible protein D
MIAKILQAKSSSNTISRLDEQKRTHPNSGAEFWIAREIIETMGYSNWDNFVGVITKARDSLLNNNVEPQKHVLEFENMLETGNGAKRPSVDFYLSRLACYLIAMNGDSSKPEIADAQAYFAKQTRLQEIDYLEKRLELREKVTKSFKRVSGVARDAGVKSEHQGIFHDARYQGLYNVGAKEVKRQKGLEEKDHLFDHASSLELSMHDFQMNLAADVIKRENIKNETLAVSKNKTIAQQVRKAVEDSGATLPEDLQLDRPIKEVKKLVKSKQKNLSQ